MGEIEVIDGKISSLHESDVKAEDALENIDFDYEYLLKKYTESKLEIAQAKCNTDFMHVAIENTVHQRDLKIQELKDGIKTMQDNFNELENSLREKLEEILIKTSERKSQKESISSPSKLRLKKKTYHQIKLEQRNREQELQLLKDTRNASSPKVFDIL